MADDTGDGLTAATAKKTLPAAVTLFTNGSWTAGDQLMLAGTGGRSYSDDGLSQGWNSFAGFSATYPTAVLCYDPASPSDATKYGKLYGQDRPRYLYPDINSVPSYLAGSTRPFIENPVDSGASNFAMQGIIVDAQNFDTAATGTIGRHDNLCWQNCQIKQLELGNNNAASARGRSQNINVSKCSFFAPWRALDGNTSGMFSDTTDGLWVQDNVFVHCGWQIGASRDDLTMNGGTGVFGHSSYFAAGNINGHYDRNVFIDSSTDGCNLRGSANATQTVAIDDAIGPSVTGFSSSYLDNPGGSVVTYNDFAIIGGSNLWSPAATGSKGDGARGGGFGGKNSNGASTINNGVMFDNPNMNGANSRVASFDYTSTSAVHEIFNISNVKTHNYSAVAQSASYAGIDPTALIVNWTNCLLDNLSSVGTAGAGTISGTGVRTWVGGDYPNALTKAQVITALGFANKAAMVNAMLDYAHLSWAQAILGLSFTGYAVTPISATASVPSIAGLATPAVVYPTALGTLALSATSFTRGTPAVVLVSGLAANSVVSCADLPAGFSMTAFGLQFQTGSVTSGSNQLTSVSSVVGVTPGMYVTVSIGGTVAVPYGAFVVSVVGSTITMSANATATGAATNVSFFRSGRAIHYDGTGSGAATPTIHVLETNLDDLGTNTTPVALSIGSGVAGTIWSTSTGVDSSDWTLSNASLTALRTANNAFNSIIRTAATKNGSTVLFTIDAIGGGGTVVGFDNGSETGALGAGVAGNSVGYFFNGNIEFAGDIVATGATFTTGDVIKIVRSGTGGSIYTFYKNNVSQGSIDTASATYGLGAVMEGAVYPAVYNSNSTGIQVTADFTGW